MHSDFKTACLISANSWGVVPLAGPRLSKRVRPFLHSSDEGYDSWRSQLPMGALSSSLPFGREGGVTRYHPTKAGVAAWRGLMPIL